ncbi:MAG: glycerate kinase [Eubacterium sp.]|nr:glycerate kinase [Eubacterium sp.]
MKILIIPDSYKGSLSSKQVGEIIKHSLEEDNQNLEISALPFSDGGEGFGDCICEICKGNRLYTNCHNIFGERIKAPIITFGDTAVIETASASGLLKRKNVMKASSYGTGELIKFAVSQGFSDIVLGLGGSGCCDGGAGALAALGADFYDESYKRISTPRGMDLNYIFGFSVRNIVKPIHFTYGTDVENEYYGKNGAAYVFAPQKGANDAQVKELDEGLKRLNAFFKNDISDIKGSGAAGGICGGLYSVYGGNIKSGFDILSEYSQLESKIMESDLIITGEGKTDAQTLMGKLPYKISGLAAKYGKKCVVISGEIEDVTLGDKMISLIDENTPAEYAVENAEKVLFEKAKFILK